MIQNLKIKNFVLIDDLDIDFNSGFNVLIGETGAGKSILVNALSLLTGTRSQFDKLNDESKKAIIEASFVLNDNFISSHPILKDYVEDNTLIISRSLSPSKATTIRINGELVTLNELKSVMQDVVSITSQGEQNSLMNPITQLSILDKFIDKEVYKKCFKEFSEAYNSYLNAIKERDEFISSNIDKDLDVLTYRLEEINKKNIKEGEIEAITKVLKEQEENEDLLEGGNLLEDLYNSETYENFARELSKALNKLSTTSLSEKAMEGIKSWEELSDNIFTLVNSFGDNEIDEKTLEKYNERLYELTPLMKKYGPSTEDILKAKKELEDHLDEANHYEEFLKEKEKAIEDKKDEAINKANELTYLRQKAKDKVVTSCNSHLSSLGLRNDGFNIDFKEKELSSNGKDEVSFIVSLNKGHSFVPLNVAASGGEKSRLMLALIASFNSFNPSDTLVFDEVDTGVSGTIALEVGKKILEISKNSSILAISHLPQVVSSADHYYLVYKYDENEKTISSIKHLDEDNSLIELAKMIGGESNLDEAMSLAKKMIKEQKQLI